MHGRVAARAGELAAHEDCLIQTHCSESDWEHDYVRQRMGVNDTVALDRLGLLRRGTVLAHSCFMTARDMALVQARVPPLPTARCPTPISRALSCMLRAAWQAGMHVGWARTYPAGIRLPSRSMPPWR
ncbi:amidohydrolase family protein [Komagataeibacter rhaeticus]|nr:amidohydrolase family protein [Komagataeibacter rhaeticus]